MNDELERVIEKLLNLSAIAMEKAKRCDYSPAGCGEALKLVIESAAYEAAAREIGIVFPVHYMNVKRRRDVQEEEAIN